MTRIVNYAHRTMRPPKWPKQLADVPGIVTPADTKKGRHPVLAREAAAEVGTRLGQGGDGETEASTVTRVAGHDRSVTTQPANNDRKPEGRSLLRPHDPPRPPATAEEARRMMQQPSA
jgi:hypothetical protein